MQAEWPGKMLNTTTGAIAYTPFNHVKDDRI